MIVDYLEAESLIIERLREKLPEIKAFPPAESLDSVERAVGQKTPAVFVIYDGEHITPSRGDLPQNAEQRWLVVVATRNINDPSGKSTREKAGPLMAKIIRALQGWKPGPQFGKLSRAPATGVLYSDTFSYFPLAFTTTIVTEGEP